MRQGLCQATNLCDAHSSPTPLPPPPTHLAKVAGVEWAVVQQGKEAATRSWTKTESMDGPLPVFRAAFHARAKLWRRSGNFMPGKISDEMARIPASQVIHHLEPNRIMSRLHESTTRSSRARDVAWHVYPSPERGAARRTPGALRS